MGDGPVDLVVRGARVLTDGRLRYADVGMSGGRIAALSPTVEPPRGATVLDGSGCVVLPGLVDIHTHLREPGGEESETVATGARAAALGGYTAVVAMPNTDPPIDCASVARDVMELGRGACARVAVAGAISVGRRGDNLAPLGEMAALGVRLFTDDGAGVQDSALMRAAFQYAAPLGVTLAQHCEVAELSAGAVMHEGEWSSRLGLTGAPAEAEHVMVWRDIALAHSAGCPLHLMHLSSAVSVEILRAARARGVRVTGEVTPHHLSLTDAELASFDTVFKVNPPLRSEPDRRALRAALSDGTLDAVATDHAPHAPQWKEAPLDQARPGMIGLETALAVVLTTLADLHLGEDHFQEGRGLDDGAAATWRDGDRPASGGEGDRWVEPAMAAVASLMSARPAAIAGLSGQGRPIAEGEPANLVVVDPAELWKVDPSSSASRSRNTPFAGRTLRGRVRHTVYAGEAVVVDAAARR